MKPDFRFKLNGIVIPEIRIQRALVNGERVGELEMAVLDDALGWFAIDDNSELPDEALPKFVLEYRNETSWALVPPYERQISEDKGWKTVTPQGLLKVLHEAGYITVTSPSTRGSGGQEEIQSRGSPRNLLADQRQARDRHRISPRSRAVRCSRHTSSFHRSSRAG